MVGFQAYPSNLEDIKIGRIKELVKMYPNCQIGYADHSSYDNEMAIISNEYAYILGARFFEKHIAFEEGKKRIDFQSAVSADKIKIIKCRIEYLDKLLNIDKKGLFDMTEKEISYRNRQKIPVAKFDLEAAHLLSGDDLELKMIDSNQAIAFEQHLIGHKLKVNIPKNASFVKEAIYD
jgi:N,N'-diacetyllegionaminate synthase